ncbi:hypothetical protein IQ254_11350 [Nodosilinea sp. LEGE 07088]|uniref:hypothetical protein n=1 Tax=Nodosilinea sp. LEGE 07088 TaxID=2777968 RepID=UPI00187E8BB2|nr:hypothetical protein [Nodosilinea sp. LEGE 07088]MBE9137780.1 hypothetical protein [Nodosilinea sp. LEGE 07088]
MNTFHWLAAATVLGICSAPVQATAAPQDLQTTPLTMADALAADQHSQSSLSRLANQMGQQVGRQANSGTPDVIESLNIPLLDDLLDESGNLNLPLGLTVYDAMGTTSIGFGSEF